MSSNDGIGSIEVIFSKEFLNRVDKKVVSNKEASGVDWVKVEKLDDS